MSQYNSNEYRGPQRDGERRSDLAVMDANEYKQKRRLERILDAMDRISDAAAEAKRRYVAGEITQDARNIIVQDAVDAAIWEAWNLLVEHDRECRRRALDTASENGSDPPDVSDAGSEYFSGSEEREPIGRIEQDRSDTIDVNGLREFYNLSEYWTERWQEPEKPRNLPARTTTRTTQHTVPERVSWAAAIRLKEFLGDVHDLEVQFEALDGSKLPAIKGFDQSGEEPKAELDIGEYNRGPDL